MDNGIVPKQQICYFNKSQLYIHHDKMADVSSTIRYISSYLYFEYNYFISSIYVPLFVNLQVLLFLLRQLYLVIITMLKGIISTNELQNSYHAILFNMLLLFDFNN